MAVLPYVTAPGNIDRALRGIQSAATPESVSQDFVKTILLIPGGSGNQMTSFLKKLASSMRTDRRQLFIENSEIHRLPGRQLLRRLRLVTRSSIFEMNICISFLMKNFVAL